MDEDFLLAIRLQEQFDSETSSPFTSNRVGDDELGQNSKKRKLDDGGDVDVVPHRRPPERPLSIVDASWETLDPSPDVRGMFLQFNDMFFWGKLCGVEVKWSPRMTLCAGVCSYEGRGGLCSIRLSEPLLKLRPRKDLVETLLHEMIHALLFVTQNNRDRDGHGPEFCNHMNRINKATGTKISVYHSFHDEVDVYRQHWWRCDGPCQSRKPYFGYVKRAMNRAPSSQDPWWGDHQRTCGGTYTKVKEPEGYGKKKGGKKEGKAASKEASGIGKASSTTNGKPSSTTAGTGSQDIRNIIPFSGKGFLLGGSSLSATSSSPSRRPTVPVEKTPSPSSISPPKKRTPPSFPAITPPVPSRGFPSARPAAPAGPRPPTKRSVSNTRVFVNVNGSPVRIPKPNGSSGSGRGAEKTKQRTIRDLFNDTGVGKSDGQSSSDKDANRGWLTSPRSVVSASSASTSLSSSSKPVVPNEGVQDQPEQSKYFNYSNTEGESGGPTSRPRQGGIFDFFQKTQGADSAASRESTNTKSPAVRQRTATATSSSSSSSFTASSLSVPASSSSSSSLMVSCPVCQAKVQESKINEHLDSCIS
ncbi:DNA-dependent metalloprotease SPRTN [Scophthalmus maximus]|uniref:DNA-dependent metalloprotease SPRTN n=1 Tax=Scophthalmus maximus TaxID=52904 RepID=UPI001FA82A3C|nr:DNA-dependent metalloprotease SPRTN [Scophthalmus maximus]